MSYQAYLDNIRKEINQLNQPFETIQGVDTDIIERINQSQKILDNLSITPSNLHELALRFLELRKEKLTLEIYQKERALEHSCHVVERLANKIEGLQKPFQPCMSEHVMAKMKKRAREISDIGTMAINEWAQKIELANQDNLPLQRHIALLDEAIANNNAMSSELIQKIEGLLEQSKIGKVKHVNGESLRGKPPSFFEKIILENPPIDDLVDHLIYFAGPNGSTLEFRINTFQKQHMMQASEFFKKIWGENFKEKNTSPLIVFENDGQEIETDIKILQGLFQKFFPSKEIIRTIVLIDQFQFNSLKVPFSETILKLIPELDLESQKALLEYLQQFPTRFIANYFGSFCKKIFCHQVDHGTMNTLREVVEIFKELNLKELDLSYSMIQDHHLDVLLMLELTSLNIDHCYSITWDGIHIVGKISSLESFSCNFFDNSYIKHGLNKLWQLKKLKHLSLSHLLYTSVLSLQEMQVLEKLSLKHCQITEKELIQLQQLPLTELDLSYCTGLAGHGLRFLPKTLQTLNLTGCLINEVDLFGLSSLPLLKELTLCHWRHLTDQGVKDYLKVLPLKKLNLSYCSQLTDKAVAHLGGNKELELNFSYTNLKNLDTKDLEIKSLQLYGCSLSKENLDNLKIKYPNISLSEPIEISEPEMRIVNEEVKAILNTRQSTREENYFNWVQQLCGRIFSNNELNKCREFLSNLTFKKNEWMLSSASMITMLHKYHVWNLAVNKHGEVFHTDKIDKDERWIINFFSKSFQDRAFTICTTQGYPEILKIVPKGCLGTADIQLLNGKFQVNNKTYPNLIELLDDFGPINKQPDGSVIKGSWKKNLLT